MSPQAFIDLRNESFSVNLAAGGGSIPEAGTFVHDTIARNGYKRIQMPLFAMGLLSQPNILPLRMLDNLVLEMELTPDAGSWLNTAAGRSTEWRLEDICLKMDLLTLDPEIDAQIMAKLQQGVELPIPIRTFLTTTQVLAARDFDINITRGLSKLVSLFVNFETAADAGLTTKPGFVFYYPTGAGDDPEWQLQIGSSKWPSYPVRGTREAYYRLRQAMATQGSRMHSYAISMANFESSHYCIAVDTEKEASAAWTGENMRSGQQIHLMCRKYSVAADAAHPAPIKAYLHLCAEYIITVSDAGISVLE